MNLFRKLSLDIFSEYQKTPVPLEQWVKKVGDTGDVLCVPERGLLLYHTRESDVFGVSTHIWLCGVKKEYRRSGVFKDLLKSMLGSPCHPTISLHLNQSKFPEMAAVLKHLGFFLVSSVPEKNLDRFEIASSELRDTLFIR